MEDVSIRSEKRDQTGTRAMKRMRKAGQVPAVLYGKELTTLILAIPSRDIETALRKGAHIVTLDGAGGKQKVLIKKVQYDPLGDRVVHVDFHKISLTEKIEMDVPVIYKGTAAGVAQEGGVLIEHAKTLRVRCLPTDIPKQITVDVTTLKLHDKLRLKEIEAPPKVEFTASPEYVVAAVMEPKAIEEPAPAEAEATAAATTEPEIIKKGKKEEEGAEAAAAPAAKKEKEEAKPEKK
jgi:large subunit ribosomal protein L25